MYKAKVFFGFILNLYLSVFVSGGIFLFQGVFLQYNYLEMLINKKAIAVDILKVIFV